MGCAIRIICNNKKAYHNYFIQDTYECGIELLGSEVKSIRQGGMSINDAFVVVGNEIYLKNAYIKPYKNTSMFVPNSLRDRKLLLHRHEIDKISKQTSQKGMAIIPIKVYIKKGIVKVEIGVGKGKKLYDKRQTLKENTLKRNMQRELKNC